MSEQPVRRPAKNANSVARRKAIRRKKLMKKRLILAGMLVGALAVIALIVFLIVKLVSGASFAETTTMKIASDGSITMDEVDDFSESNYDEDELEEYTKKLVDDYNNSGNVGKVKFKKVKVKDKKAYLRMEYSDYNAYKSFTGNELFIGTVGEAKTAGYDFQDTFSSVSDGQKKDAISVEDMTGDDSKKVILVRANETIVTPSDITAISDACTTIDKKDQVSIAQPDGNMDATVLTTIVYK
ncbi:MAG: hypothetical protein IJU02_06040 [Lachnospiraceae bacterium]|nr:hypothetical protein [Lachnospiraceae bacterium]